MPASVTRDDRRRRRHRARVAAAAYLADKGYPDARPSRIAVVAPDCWVFTYLLPDGRLELEVADTPDGWQWHVRAFRPA